MKVEYKQARVQFKNITETGRFSGYAAIFSNVDRVGDVLLPGAIKEIEDIGDSRVVVLPGHDDTGFPIGGAKVWQDDTGLAFDGALVLEDPRAQIALAHMRAGTVTGMSIGYSVLDGGEKFRDDGVREVSAIKVWEISPVTFPANPKARVTAVKSWRSSVRDLERALVATLGCSSREAKAIASHGFKGLDRQRDAGPDGSEIRQIAQQLQDTAHALTK